MRTILLVMYAFVSGSLEYELFRVAEKKAAIASILKIERVLPQKFIIKLVAIMFMDVWITTTANGTFH